MYDAHNNFASVSEEEKQPQLISQERLAKCKKDTNEKKRNVWKNKLLGQLDMLILICFHLWLTIRLINFFQIQWRHPKHFVSP